MNFKRATDNELAEEAQTGLRGQGAVVEMMRRLKNSILEQEKSTSKLNTLLLYFTIAIFLLTFTQVILLFVQSFAYFLPLHFNFVQAIWLIFFSLFLIMTIKEFIQSKKGLEVQKMDLGFSDLNNAYETTREAIIESDKSSHRIAATAYFLAALVALASFIFSIL